MGWESAAAGMASMAVNAKLDKKNREFVAQQNELNRQFNHDEAILAHGRQIEIMDKQNEWNSYSNQRKLLQSAGYNPNALFNSASTLSASSGASGGAQANTPNVGYPQRLQFDPMTFSNILLNMSQAKNLDADTNKKNSETVGQTLMNDYQEVANSIYKDYGRLQAEYNLNKTDSERALNDGHRILMHVQTLLNYDELYNMRPKEASNFIADSVMKESQTLLNRAAAAKTDQERDLLVKQYIWATRVAASTIALNYANASYARTQANLWTPDWNVNSPKGIMFRKAFNDYKNSRVDYEMNRLEYRYRSSVFNDLYDSWKNSVFFELEAKNLYNSKVKQYLDKFELNSFGGALMQGLSLGKIPYNYRNPGPPTNSSIQFPLGF